MKIVNDNSTHQQYYIYEKERVEDHMTVIVRIRFDISFPFFWSDNTP